MTLQDKVLSSLDELSVISQTIAWGYRGTIAETAWRSINNLVFPFIFIFHYPYGRKYDPRRRTSKAFSDPSTCPHLFINNKLISWCQAPGSPGSFGSCFIGSSLNFSCTIQLIRKSEAMASVFILVVGNGYIRVRYL